MFWELNNNIKISLKLKRKFTKMLINKNNFNLLKIYLKLNIIKFVKIKKKNLIIYLNLNNQVKSIFNEYTPGQKKIINLKNLKNLTLKKNNLLILSTTSGLITNLQALKLKKGGVLITKFLI